MSNENEKNNAKKQKVTSVKKKNNSNNNTKVKKDNSKLKALEDENKNLNDKVLRLSAEMQNIKRRNEEEISKIYKYEGEELINKLLPIVDNFERAIMLDDRDLTDELSKFLSGFKMIYTNLLSILSEYDVKEIDCKGLEFDPNTMEAVLTEKDESIPANMVIEVLQKGYTYKDKVIRHAMVKVSE